MIRKFQESLRHNPDKAAPHFNLGLTCDDMRDGEQSVAHAEP